MNIKRDMLIDVVIPLYNGGDIWKQAAEAITEQEGIRFRVTVIDSSSTDGSFEVAAACGFKTHVIEKKDFNHGGTRNIPIDKLDISSEFIVFLTQDAVLSEASSIKKIIDFFSDASVAAVCGRQIPHDSANPLASHARYFNYPSQSSIKSIDDVSELGIKTVFISNSFAAYRVSALKAIGGFPSNTILCEDMYAVAKMLKSGYKVGYCAEAVVKHSHNYTPIEEFKRYFDIGVFHAMEPWIQKEFGGAGGEGIKFVKSELCYLWKRHKLWIPLALINNSAKILGMKLGSKFNLLPLWVIRKCSMHHRFWQNGKPSVK